MRRKLRTVVLILMSVIGVGLVLALFLPSQEPEFDAFRKANEAFNMGDFSSATEILEPLAQAGDQRAVEYMAYMEAFGLGRPINRDRAQEWITATRENDAITTRECSIGIYWATGHFGTKDINEAAYWIRRSNTLRAQKPCLSSFQGQSLPNDLRTQVEEALLAFSTE